MDRSMSLALWKADGDRFGYEMPAAPWWKRLPVIRHIRALIAAYRVENHNRFYRALGMIPTGYDSWVVFGIAQGFEVSE